MKAGALLITSVLFILGGCANTRTIALTTPFDASSAKAQLADGANSIKGSALIRQMGGGIVTCAGRPVVLMPATAMADEWATHLYGSPNGGYFSASSRGIQFQGADELFAEVKQTTCNAQGNFSFNNVSNGQFLVFTRITWLAGGIQQGGSIMRRVTLADGKSLEVVLTPGD